MTALKWDKRLETGIAEVDNQHRELFKRIDSLELSLYGGKLKVEVVVMIDYLESYVEEHFDAEETLMLRINYPDIGKHRQEHQEFREVYKKIKNEYEIKGADSYMALDVDKEIRKWWEKHILKSDMAFVPYVREKDGDQRK
jgi:hemerythrin